MNVPPLQPHNESQPDEQTLSQYAEHTRKSLIARLENWEDQRTWDEFTGHIGGLFIPSPSRPD